LQQIGVSHKGQNAKLKPGFEPEKVMTEVENREHFTSANQNAKVVRAIATLVRRARLDYDGFRRMCAQVRKDLGIRRPPRSRHSPESSPMPT
jgi:hypothetical protein